MGKSSINGPFSTAMLNNQRVYIYTHDGSMVLLYMVLHGSHQYTPNVSIYTSTMDPMGNIVIPQHLWMAAPQLCLLVYKPL